MGAGLFEFKFQSPKRKYIMKILELENEPLSKLRGMAKTLNIPNSNPPRENTS